MTAKQKAARAKFKQVVAEAKKLRKKNPKLTQAQAVKQAWAIAKKVGAIKIIEKGESKSARPSATYQQKRTKAGTYSGLKKVGAVKKKAAKKSVAKSYHKDTKSHNVNIRVVSGVKHNEKIIKAYKETLGRIRYYETTIDMFKLAIKKAKERGLTPYMVKSLKDDIKKSTNIVKELKIHARELKKHL